jgi:hypothetical protein
MFHDEEDEHCLNQSQTEVAQDLQLTLVGVGIRRATK